jgi:8-oxo-dGTP pyrophosphatase MutT (NUDIX family)
VTANHWTTLNTTRIYESSWLRLIEDEIIRPDGSIGKYGVLQTRGGIGVVALTELQEVFLVAQYRYATQTYSLEIPKGAFTSFEADESPLEAAVRELKEETGLVARSWEKLHTVHTLMGYSDDIVHLFLARELTSGDAQPDDVEEIELVRVPLERIVETIRKGVVIKGIHADLTDATSITGLLLARAQLGY